MPDVPRWTDAEAWGAAPLKFLPTPLTVTIGRLNPQRRWRVSLANGLHVENEPPLRMILVGDRTVACYPVADEVQERLALVALVAQGWMPAAAWAAAWGLHRNTLSNWAWRYRHFGLDGLRDGLLPERQRLQAIVTAGQEMIAAQQGVGFTVAALEQELGRRQLGGLPRSALQWLWRQLAAALASSEDGQGTGAKAGPGLLPVDPGSSGDGNEAWLAQEPGADEAATAQDARPEDAGEQAPACPARAATGPAEDEAMRSGESAGADADRGAGVDETEAQSCAAEVSAVPAVQQPVPATAVPMRYGGLALALPALQGLLDPLEDYLQQAWGQRRWRYAPWALLSSFILYLVMGVLNPERVKAAPSRDFGPLLGRKRAPACITLRRRLPAMARTPTLVAGLQRALAVAYLRLGWVRPGAWLVDGHFSPYHGEQNWGKGWWPQRRLAVRGYFQDWVADRRGRPLWLHLTQGFELFTDQLPLIASGLRSLLTEAGADPDVVLVFDRGGYCAALFAALNALGIGWVTWLKGKVSLPKAAFTDQGSLPPSQRRPDEPGRTVHYTRTTHAVTGLGDVVPAIAWHEGDPRHQVALLSNLDARFPGRFTALQQIAMLDGRWAQENAYKAMTHDFDLDWTNGYDHEPAAATQVPNPTVRRLKQRRGQRTVQLRHAMDRAPELRTPKAAARNRRKIGMLKGQLTRIDDRLARLPETVPYATLRRAATVQLQPGRGVLIPILRAAAYHITLQMRDAVSTVFADHREWDKALDVILHTPGYYVPGVDAARVILDAPPGAQQPRYRRALELLISRLNAAPPHAPGRPDHPLRFDLASASPTRSPLHNAPEPLAPQ